MPNRGGHIIAQCPDCLINIYLYILSIAALYLVLMLDICSVYVFTARFRVFLCLNMFELYLNIFEYILICLNMCDPGFNFGFARQRVGWRHAAPAFCPAVRCLLGEKCAFLEKNGGVMQLPSRI